MAPVTVAVALPSLTGLHVSSRTMAQVAGVELRRPCRAAGQRRSTCVVTTSMPPSSSTVIESSVARSAPESASRSSQYVSIAECPVDLFDAALVLGGHVE